MQGTNSFDVFISHSAKDSGTASAIKQTLQREGIRCWKAPDDILAGESRLDATTRAVRACRVVVLVWSSNSAQSADVSKELTLAMDCGLTVVPFKIESGEQEMMAISKLSERLKSIFKEASPVRTSGASDEGGESLGPPPSKKALTTSVIDESVEIFARKMEQVPDSSEALARSVLFPSDRLVLVRGGTTRNTEKHLSARGLSPCKDFWMGKYPVTFGEWKTVRDWAVTNGYEWGSKEDENLHDDSDDVGLGDGEDHPVTYLSWYDAVKWCNALSEMEGKVPVYHVKGTVYRSGEFGVGAVQASFESRGYRLPSVEEWHWAASGGVNGKGCKYSGGDDITEVGWTIEELIKIKKEDDRKKKKGFFARLFGSSSNTMPVGKKRSNEAGLYDMSGNVQEWCGADDFGRTPACGGSGSLESEFAELDNCSEIYEPHERLHGLRVVLL